MEKAILEILQKDKNLLDKLQNITNESQQPDDIEEQYKIWKQNTYSIYDILQQNNLIWPSLTTQWLQKQEPCIKNNFIFNKQKIILGTQTSGQEQNKLMLMNVTYPETDKEKNNMISSKEYYSTYQEINKSEIIRELNHSGDINKARVSPFNQDIVVTKSSNGNLYLFDISKENTNTSTNTNINSTSISDDIDKSDAIGCLKGHSEEGYGLCWSFTNKDMLISGSNDGNVCVYDVNYFTGNENKTSVDVSNINPIKIINDHKEVVEDVCFSRLNANLFGSVGDDSCIRLYDSRTFTSCNVISNIHTGNINCIDFNHKNEHLFITGSDDQTIKLWDMRDLSRSLYSFDFHDDSVFSVKWSPHSDCLFASGSADSRLMFWDITLLGNPLASEDEEDGPNELIVSHQGHRSKVVDFDWNPSQANMISSTEDERGSFQIFKFRSELFYVNENNIKIK